MLLGSIPNNVNNPLDGETLILQLILQQRYAEVYELLMRQKSPSTSALYNTALCLHWAGNYQGALSTLERIQLKPEVKVTNSFDVYPDYKMIKNKQNQTADYLHGISDAYVQTFSSHVHDAILRLKIDCWLQLGDYAKVIIAAMPMAHKGYKNITDALILANKANDK
jgi:hypothetical protein